MPVSQGYMRAQYPLPMAPPPLLIFPCSDPSRLDKTSRPPRNGALLRLCSAMYRVVRGRPIPPVQKCKPIIITFNDSDDDNSASSDSDEGTKEALMNLKQQRDQLKRRLERRQVWPGVQW